MALRIENQNSLQIGSQVLERREIGDDDEFLVAFKQVASVWAREYYGFSQEFVVTHTDDALDIFGWVVNTGEFTEDEAWQQVWDYDPFDGMGDFELDLQRTSEYNGSAVGLESELQRDSLDTVETDEVAGVSVVLDLEDIGVPEKPTDHGVMQAVDEDDGPEGVPADEDDTRETAAVLTDAELDQMDEDYRLARENEALGEEFERVERAYANSQISYADYVGQRGKWFEKSADLYKRMNVRTLETQTVDDGQDLANSSDEEVEV